MRGLYSSSRKRGSVPGTDKKAVRKENPAPSNQEGASAPKPANLIPLNAWPRQWPTRNRWKQLLRKRDENGLAVAVVKIGNEILIDEAAFDAWALSHREGGAR